MADLNGDNYTELLNKVYQINLDMSKRMGNTESMLQRFSDRTDQRIYLLEKDLKALKEELELTKKEFKHTLENSKLTTKFKKNAGWIIPVTMFIIAFCLLYREHLISMEPGKNHSFVYTFFRDYVK